MEDVEKEDRKNPEGEAGRGPAQTGMSLKGVLEGGWFADWLRKNLLYVLLVAALAIYCIYNVYDMEKLHRRREGLEKEVKELRSESVSAAADLMLMRKRSEVVKRIREEGLDLGHSEEPPVKLYRK